MELKGSKISFLGGGAMGEALIAGLLRKGLTEGSAVTVSDIEPNRLDYLRQKYGVNTTNDNVAATKGADMVVLAVKPFIMDTLLAEISQVIQPSQTLISIAAGITIFQMERALRDGIPVVRAIPNTPCLIGEGATALAPGTYALEKDLARAMAVFMASGQAVVLSESHIDAVTGLSGSGPAYVYLLLEGFVDGAVRLGVPRDTARLLMAQTMLGAAKMVLDSGEHPGKLKDMVTTPGGTTMAGLFALEDGGARGLMMRAVAAAANRATEMAESN